MEKKEIAIKSRRSRTASGAKFSIVKYKGETIKALVSILVLRMETSKLDHVFDVVASELGISETVSENDVIVGEEGGDLDD